MSVIHEQTTKTPIKAIVSKQKEKILQNTS